MKPGSDEPLDSEVADALEGVNLQEVDLPPRRAAAGAAQSDEAAAKREAGFQRGTVVGVEGDDVIVELGPRMQGVISSAEFDAPPAVGESYDFSLQGQEDGLWLLSRKQVKVLEAWNDVQVGSLVKARVTGHNSGGLELSAGGLRGFMPFSHVGLQRVEDPSELMGQTLVCEVLELDRSAKRLLLSRRRVLEREREQQRAEAVDTLVPGTRVRGKVTRVESFGAFVDIGGGLEGLVHVSNLSRKRVENAADFIDVGAEVEAEVLKVEDGGKRIGLGMKQLEPDPWDDVTARYSEEQVVSGKVSRVADFGAFVELEPGLDGLLHVSQIDPARRVRRVDQVLSVGEELAVRIVSIDPAQRRMSLSRLDGHGALIGSEDAVDAAEVHRVIEESESRPAGTNLGALFKKALEGGD